MLDEKQAAKHLGVSARTLRNWRVRGGGPKFVRVSARCIRYKRGDLQDWIDRRIASHTSQYSPKQL
ncbi:DNA-binding protein [Hyphomonas sp. KY3]|nr:DNA-binding protein [Hyphomonas sp. KY3]